MKRRRFLKLLGLLGLGGAVAGGMFVRAGRASNGYYSGPKSDHFDGVHFFNPGGHAPKGFKELLRWQLNGEKKKWPERFPSPHSDTPPERVNGNEMRVSYVGHATMLLQTGGLNILFDPVWSQRASPVSFAGPKRVNDPGIPFEKLPPIDVVMISHNHYDHLDTNTVTRLHRAHDPLFVAPLGNDKVLLDTVANMRIKVADWGDTVNLAPNIQATLEPAHHWSARGITDRRNALWAAFAIKTPGGLVYHVGDTGFHDGKNYRALREKHGTPRLAILPFGAYQPRDFMKNQHQNPDEAVKGHLLCGAQYTLGHHWGTFQLTDESIEDQLSDLETALRENQVDPATFQALRPGQFWNIPQTNS